MIIKLESIDCSMCNKLDEDGGHLFLKCKLVKPIWRHLVLEDVRLSLLAAQTTLMLFEMVCALPIDIRSFTLILLWDWWTVHNKKNAECKDRSVAEVCHLIRMFRFSTAELATIQPGYYTGCDLAKAPRR